MKRFSFLFGLIITLMACQRDYDTNNKPYHYINKEASVIIQINELNDFLGSIENQDILSDIHNKELKIASKVLQHLNPKKKLYVSFSNDKEGNTDYLILTQNDSTLFIIDSIPNHTSETLLNFKIEKTLIDTINVYHKTSNNVFAASNNLDLIKTIDRQTESKDISNLIETTNDKSVASLIFKSNAADYSKLLFNKLEDDRNNKNYTVIDLSYNESNLKYNGIVNSKDSITSIINCFKNTIPQKISVPDIAIRSTKSLLSISYDNFSVFNKNLNKLKTETSDTTQTFLNFTNEIAFIETKTEKAIILHALDTDLVLESIFEKSLLETYRDIDIYEVENKDFFESRLKPLIALKNAKYFAIYKKFIIFSDNIEMLKNILADALNNKVLSNSNAYLNISENLSDEASLFIFKNSDALSEHLDKTIREYDANVVQFIYEKDYAHVNGVFQKYKKRAVSNSIEESFTTKIDADLIAPPQTVRNHITKAHDIVVQDVNNTLYLISNSGTLLWKKQLQGKVLGKIEQIDSYKNGRLQLAFATENRIYLLDRNGKDVSPFPLKFNDKITQPLSVFDYDNNENYRLLVTQGKNQLMYDAKGKTVEGYNYTNNGYDVTSQPQHFRVASKDYIAFTAGEKLKILNRKGQIRINVKDNIKFSNNPLYLYQNKFTTTNTFGQLIQVNTSGNLSTKNLNLSEKHKIVTTSKTLVSLEENKLNIKSRTVDLDFGDYTEPRIFYLNDKIYVTVTDLQAKKVYLFDSQAKSIPNFPVFGTSAAELQKLDNDKGLELITQSDSNTIVVYKLH